jgi:membrane protein implicated in regulation of membrane protease activity
MATHSPQFTPHSFDGEAIVEAIVRQGTTWRVRYHASWWFAHCDYPVMLFPGDIVQVVGRQNITLLIEPRSPE